jgi:hypothetical protein
LTSHTEFQKAAFAVSGPTPDAHGTIGIAGDGDGGLHPLRRRRCFW